MTKRKAPSAVGAVKSQRRPRANRINLPEAAGTPGAEEPPILTDLGVKPDTRTLRQRFWAWFWGPSRA